MAPKLSKKQKSLKFQNKRCKKEPIDETFDPKPDVIKHVKLTVQTDPFDGNETATSKKQYVCFVCEKRYTTKFTLGRHMKSIHDLSCDNISALTPTRCKTNPDSCSSQMLPCPMCSKGFMRRARLKRHILKEHPDVNVKTVCPPKLIKSVLCPVCSAQVRNVIAMYDHIRTCHPEEEIGECQKLTFENKEDFMDWKSAEEKRSLSSFVVKNNRKGAKTHRYYCHRSGIYRTSGAAKRHLKNQGSCKIGSRCPAYIKATFSELGVMVSYVDKHIGHDMEIKHIRLLKEDRMAIAEMMSAGIPKDEILERIRDNLSPTEVSRLHLIRRADLNNIMMEFKLGSRQQSDADPPWPGEEIEIVIEPATEDLTTASVFSSAPDENSVLLEAVSYPPKTLIESLSEFDQLCRTLRANLVSTDTNVVGKTNLELKTLMSEMCVPPQPTADSLEVLPASTILTEYVHICEDTFQSCGDQRSKLLFRKPLLSEVNTVTCAIEDWEGVVSGMSATRMYTSDEFTYETQDQGVYEQSYVTATTTQDASRYIPSQASSPAMIYCLVGNPATGPLRPDTRPVITIPPLGVVTSLDIVDTGIGDHPEVVNLALQNQTVDWEIS